MNINDLYEELVGSEGADENRLFSALSERFLLFIEHKLLERADAEEIVQNAMLVISAKYRQTRFEISFSAWAHGVLQKELLRHYKKKGIRRKYFEPNPPEQSLGFYEDIDPGILSRLKKCIRQLCLVNARYARVLNLSHLGFSSDEISRKLGVTKNNLYVLLNRGRSLLKDCLEKGDITK